MLWSASFFSSRRQSPWISLVALSRSFRGRACGLGVLVSWSCARRSACRCFISLAARRMAFSSRSRTASYSSGSASARIDAAEMLTRPSSIA
jgi:hypothetical protein